MYINYYMCCKGDRDVAARAAMAIPLFRGNFFSNCYFVPIVRSVVRRVVRCTLSRHPIPCSLCGKQKFILTPDMMHSPLNK